MVSRRVPRWLPAVVVPPLIMASLAVSAGPAQASGRAAVTGGAAAWTAHTSSLGRAARGAGVDVQVYLTPRGGVAALQAAVKAVSTPGSASYRHYLTVSQYRAAYEPTADQVTAVSGWLRSNGFAVTGVEASHRYVSARGTVAAAEQAFGTTLAVYRHNGQVVTAPTSAATIPAELASQVLAVDGLDSTLTFAKPALTPPPPVFNNARPCSLFYGQVQAKYKADFSTPLPTFDGVHPPYAVCGYAPDQLRGAYEGATTLSGAGVTVAIVDAYAGANILGDANHYATIHDHSPFARGQFTQNLPSTFGYRTLCGPQGWEGEETLDVEAVHAMAPNANVRYYAATSCLDTGLRSAIERVVDQNVASVITNSWGEAIQFETATAVVAYENVFSQAAMQGISVMFSSGDSGDEVAGTGLRQTDYPTSDPLVTSVGGTATAIGATGSLSGETGWGTEKYSLAPDGKSWVLVSSFLYGSGGGYATVFNRPSYQDGVVPPGQSGRAVPDIAMDADPTTGMLIGETQRYPDGSARYSEYRIGGTSLASPLLAGMTALASEHAGTRLGMLNPAIYAQARAHASSITDVLPSEGANVRADNANGVDASAGIIYSVRTFNQDSSLVTTRGWDDVTGVGSPNAGFLTAF